MSEPAQGATGPQIPAGVKGGPPYGHQGSIGAVSIGALPVSPPASPADTPSAPLPTVPATVESTWRFFGTALGVSAPANAARAARAIRSIRGAGR